MRLWLLYITAESVSGALSSESVQESFMFNVIQIEHKRRFYAE